MSDDPSSVPTALVGDDTEVPCVDGTIRRYLNLDAAASTSALPAVAIRIHEFLPWYSSVHRGAGYKSREATNAYEHARTAMLRYRRSGRRRRRRRDHLSEHNRSNQPSRLPAPPRARRRDRLDRRRTPRQPPAVDANWPGPLRRMRIRRHLRARRHCRRARRHTSTETARDHRRVERHRMDADDRRHHHRRARSRDSGLRGRSPARTAPATSRGRGLHRMERPQDVRAVRCRRARRTPPPRSAKATRSSPAAAPSTSSTSTKWLGPTRPNAKRPDLRTSSVPSRCTPRSTSSVALAGTRSNSTTTTSPSGSVRVSPRSTTFDCSAPHSTRQRCPSQRSSSRLYRTHSSRHASAPNTRSGCDMAASARTHTCSVCCIFPHDEVYTYRDAVRRGDRRSMPGAVRASGSLVHNRRSTSIDSSRPSTTSPTVVPLH